MANTGLQKAAFIDRDGVINEERNYVHKPDDFVFIPGAIDGLRLLQNVGFKLVVVTNQAGIGRGVYAEDDFVHLTQHMRSLLLREGVDLTAIYHCPHHPVHGIGIYRVDCECRKPKPGLLFKARDELGIDLARSVLVGDKRSDIEAGRAAGVKWCVLVGSGHPVNAEDEVFADVYCASLLDAAYWVNTTKT